MEPSLAGFSPGQLLLRYGIDQAIATGHRVVDLQLGDDLDKRRWADHVYDNVHVRAASPATSLWPNGVLRGIDAGFTLRSHLRRRPL
jgi:CelD/BcsL family acetyltransferase involved in cellulose biosynthesis